MMRTTALTLLVLATSLVPTGAQAQTYGYPYGYRRNRGWRNVYIAAIVIREFSLSLRSPSTVRHGGAGAVGR